MLKKFCIKIQKKEGSLGPRQIKSPESITIEDSNQRKPLVDGNFWCFFFNIFKILFDCWIVDIKGGLPAKPIILSVSQSNDTIYIGWTLSNDGGSKVKEAVIEWSTNFDDPSPIVQNFTGNKIEWLNFALFIFIKTTKIPKLVNLFQFKRRNSKNTARIGQKPTT